jgi:putative tryptophan/tyrosine transport system substrate-binding protein
VSTRRVFLGGLAGGLLVAPRAADAQPVGKVHRIGYLGSGSSTSNPHLPGAFRQGLRELGWIEGQNIVIEYRFAEGRLDRLPALAAEVVRMKVDIIAASPTPAALAAKNATGTIPIVFTSVPDPVGLGLVASLARPGGNVTGLTYSVGFNIFGKDLELLKEAVPKARRVAVLANPASPSGPLTISEITGAARSLGLQLLLLEARGPDDFEGAFTAMAKERVGALFVVTDPAFIPHRARLVDLTAKNRLPSIFTQREDAEAGALMSYGPSLSDIYRRAATYVDKILKGAKPADLPVEQPTKFELVINLKIARALGLTIPPSLLQRADDVIQ